MSRLVGGIARGLGVFEVIGRDEVGMMRNSAITRIWSHLRNSSPFLLHTLLDRAQQQACDEEISGR